MKLRIIFFALLCISIKAHGQSSVEYYNDLGKKVNDPTGEKRLKHVLRNEFSKIISTNTPGILGNYVGISTQDNTLSFAYSFVQKRGVFQLNASGGVTDGVTNLISNSELNTGVSLGLKYSWISGQSNIAIDYDLIERVRKRDKELKFAESLFTEVSKSERRKKLEIELKKKEAKVVSLQARVSTIKKRRNQTNPNNGILYIEHDVYKTHNLQKSILESERSLLEKKVADSSAIVKTRLTELRKVRDANLKNKDPYALQQFRVDSLKTIALPKTLVDSLRKKKIELALLQKAIATNTANDVNLEATNRELVKARLDLEDFKVEKKYFEDEFEENDFFNKSSADQRKNLDEFAKARARSLKLSWFSLGGNLSNQSFKRFDPTLDVNNQIFGDNDLIPSLEFSFTRYKNILDLKGTNGKRSISYLNLAAKMRYGNNLNGLQLLTIETSDSLSVNKSAVTSLKAYQGEFESNILTTQFSADYYKFLGSNDNIGFHLRAILNTQPGLEVISLRGGLVFAVKSAKDQKSILNFELFAGLNDIFKQGEEDSLFRRNVIGLQTTIPFNFNIKPIK